MKSGALWLAKTSAPLRFVWSWPGVDVTALDPATVTVSRDPCGRWYVSFAIEVADPEQLPATGAVVGIDLGIKDFAVTSGGAKIPNPRSLARRERALARCQQRLARCQRGSANRAKARAKVARAHRKVRASRTGFLHRTSAALVRDHDVTGGDPGDACGADVRHSGSSRVRSAVKQEPQPVTAGIPVLSAGSSQAPTPRFDR